MPPSHLLTAAGLAVAGLAATVTPALALTIEPSVPIERFRAVVTSADGGQSTISWDGAERVAIREVREGLGTGTIVFSAGTETAAFGTPNGTVIRRRFAAGPDGFVGLDLIDPSLDVLLARARAGTTRLRAIPFAGRAALRGRLALPANDCAALGPGMKTIDLDRRTLLPLRIIVQRAGARTQITTLRYPSVNGPLPVNAFRPPPVGTRPFRDDLGFRRVSPTRAADALSYAPRLPEALPDGFALAVSGWAPRSATVGPEGSIPPHRQLFAAVYTRGTERIELTQRIGRAGDWDASPFGAECQPLTAVEVEINGTPATYAIGAQTAPHLYWREGQVLHTLAGPLPRAALVEIAESLTPVR